MPTSPEDFAISSTQANYYVLFEHQGLLHVLPRISLRYVYLYDTVSLDMIDVRQVLLA